MFMFMQESVFVHLSIEECILNWPHREKTCLRGFSNNTGADQPAHPRSLISAIVICVL